MAEVKIKISFELLKQQIRDLLKSDMKEESKAGLHELLGTIYDLKDELGKEGYIEIGVERCSAKFVKKD